MEGRVFQLWKDVSNHICQLGKYVVHNFQLDAKKLEFRKGNPFPAIFSKIIKGKHGFYNSLFTYELQQQPKISILAYNFLLKIRCHAMEVVRNTPSSVPHCTPRYILWPAGHYRQSSTLPSCDSHRCTHLANLLRFVMGVYINVPKSAYHSLKAIVFAIFRHFPRKFICINALKKHFLVFASVRKN